MVAHPERNDNQAVGATLVVAHPERNDNHAVGATLVVARPELDNVQQYIRK